MNLETFLHWIEKIPSGRRVGSMVDDVAIICDSTDEREELTYLVNQAVEGDCTLHALSLGSWIAMTAIDLAITEAVACRRKNTQPRPRGRKCRRADIR